MKVNDKIYSIDTVLYEDVVTCSYLVLADYAVLIDSGIKSVTYEEVVQTLKGLGLKITDLKLLLHSHGHVDHVGSNYQIVEASGCLVGAHKLDAPWVEDHELQYQQVFDAFPHVTPATLEFRDAIFGFMDQETRVDLKFDEGLIIDLGQGVAVEVFRLPGHSPGQVGYYMKEAGIMIIGDATPFMEDLSLALYYDVEIMRSTINRLRSLRKTLPFDTLLSAHYPPMRGAKIDDYLQECLNYMATFEEIVMKTVRASSDGANHGGVAQAAAQAIGKENDFVALTTSYAHLKDLEARGVIVEKDGHWIAK
jgi:glyoxylase-like metal-dependent hydrolase (beta-lactamase superfamily II)